MLHQNYRRHRNKAHTSKIDREMSIGGFAAVDEALFTIVSALSSLESSTFSAWMIIH